MTLEFQSTKITLDEHSFNVIIREKQSRLIGMIRIITGKYDVDDLFQEVCIKVRNNRHKFDPARVSSFEARFRAIARNTYIDEYRMKKNQYHFDEFNPSIHGLVGNVSNYGDFILIAQEFEVMLSKLPPGYSQYLKLTIEGNNIPEISEMLGVSIGSVKSGI